MSTQPVSSAERARRHNLRTKLRTLVDLRLQPRVDALLGGNYSSGLHNLYHQKSPADNGGHIDLHYFKVQLSPAAEARIIDELAAVAKYAATMGVVTSARKMQSNSVSLLDMHKVVESSVSIIVSFRLATEGCS